MAAGNTGYPTALDDDLIRDPDPIKNLTLSAAKHATLHTYANQGVLALQTFLGIASDYTGVAADLTLGSSVLATLKKVSGALETLRTAVGAAGDATSANTLNGRVNNLIALVGKKTDAATVDSAFGRIASVSNGLALANSAIATLRSDVFTVIGQTTDPATAATIYGMLKSKMPLSGGVFTGTIRGPVGGTSDSYVTRQTVSDTTVAKTGGTFTGQVSGPEGVSSTSYITKSQLDRALARIPISGQGVYTTSTLGAISVLFPAGSFTSTPKTILFSLMSNVATPSNSRNPYIPDGTDWPAPNKDGFIIAGFPPNVLVRVGWAAWPQ